MADHVASPGENPEELAAKFMAITPGPWNMPPTVELTGRNVREQLDEGTGWEQWVFARPGLLYGQLRKFRGKRKRRFSWRWSVAS